MQTTDEPQSSPTLAPPEAHAGHGDVGGAGPDPHVSSHAPGSPPAPTSGSSSARTPGSLPASTPSAADGRIAGRPREIGGRDGPEPTRFGDWEKAGRCIDF
jgi:hypothetical protein